MKISGLKKEFAEKGLSFLGSDFFEEGYEIRLKKEVDTELTEELQAKQLSQGFEDIENMDYAGLTVTSIEISRKVFTVILVPYTIEEMRCFAWEYVRRFCEHDQKLKYALAEAAFVLEDTINTIKNDKLEVAKKNYNKFINNVV